MGLSGQDSNNYTKLIAYRRRILAEPAHIIASNSETSVKRINEYEETEICRTTSFQKHLTNAEILEIAKAYNNGKTTYELAKKYGCCRQAISNALISVGITPSKSKAQAKMNADIVIKMYKGYKTTAEIAKRFGVHPNAVLRCLRKNNIPIRSRWDYPKAH